MTRYGEMTNYEINKAVAGILKLNTIAYDRTEIVLFDDMDATPFDPCNNPADAMPIIIENGISLIKFERNYLAAAPGFFVEGELGGEIYGLKSKLFSDNRNPYRAAMEVFLMMKDAENENV